jgi:hypothetical protein
MFIAPPATPSRVHPTCEGQTDPGPESAKWEEEMRPGNERCKTRGAAWEDALEDPLSSLEFALSQVENDPKVGEMTEVLVGSLRVQESGGITKNRSRGDRSVGGSRGGQGGLCHFNHIR